MNGMNGDEDQDMSVLYENITTHSKQEIALEILTRLKYLLTELVSLTQGTVELEFLYLEVLMKKNFLCPYMARRQIMLQNMKL